MLKGFVAGSNTRYKDLSRMTFRREPGSLEPSSSMIQGFTLPAPQERRTTSNPGAPRVGCMFFRTTQSPPSSLARLYHYASPYASQPAQLRHTHWLVAACTC
ncbi:hypothetical protein ColLi_01173 [Colletotrichum liriopes]|uniref:Uncharacterized protein n=1 Tax=Colletotrichum liriopes TaxID=708192 RepID=A0AA37GCG5_9PEZI|nr:hypothetical protein ColLi_01173 [Colletotrichum liriopes]